MKKKKKGKIISASMGLEGFVDWVDPNASDPDEEREDDMCNLVARFAARMRKWAMSYHGETTPDSEVFDGKRPKRFGLDEEAQRSSTVIAI